jgi:hypothetical protein
MMSRQVALLTCNPARAVAAQREPLMVHEHLAGDAPSGASEPSRSPREAATRAGHPLDGGVHFVPNDGRRFPYCGSWRSNWKRTEDADRATCPECRSRLL